MNPVTGVISVIDKISRYQTLNLRLFSFRKNCYTEKIMKEIQIYQTLLNHWTEQYHSLHDILNCEQLALEKRDFNHLASLAKEKNELVKQINQQQIPAIIEQGHANQPKINEVKKFCLNNLELSSSWQQLMRIVEQCHFKNEVNARLIELVSVSTKRTFNLIKGFDPDNNIYNSTGDRTIVKHYGQSISA